VSALSAIDGWISSDATQNLHEAIHSLRPQIGHTKGQGENHLICCSAFRSEMQVDELQPDEMQEPAFRGKSCDLPEG
jgi:hypothetical protein